MPPRVSWAGQVGPQRPLAHWTAARLQTLDHGASEPLLVSRELGHGSRRWEAGLCPLGYQRSKTCLGVRRLAPRTTPRNKRGRKQKPRPLLRVIGVRISGVGPARLERATSCSGGKRSIQLSYGPDFLSDNDLRLLLPFVYPRLRKHNV